MKDVELSNVTLNYGSKGNILDGASFQVNDGEKVAIVGNNGTGKTTIFKLITGEEKPTSGIVVKRKDATVGFLTQIAPDIENGVTVREYLSTAFGALDELRKRLRDLEYKMTTIDPVTQAEQLEKVIEQYGKAQDAFSDAGGYVIDSEVETIANNLKIFDLLDQSYNELSGGQKTIVCLAILLLQKPDILLLDEPTNHLDIPTLGWLEEFIKGYRGSVILVSHDRYFLDKTIGKIFAIDGGKIKTYFGNYTQYVEQVAAEREIQEQEYTTQQKKIEKMEETIRKNRAWGAQSSEKAYRVAKQMERRIEEMDKVERPKTQRDIALKFNQETRSGNDVLVLDDITFSYDGDEIILCGASLELGYQDKVCLIGKNGTGKSTVLKIILGQLQGYDGTVALGSNVKIGYLPQHVSFDDDKRTVLEEFQKHFTGSLTQARATLASFHFYAEDVQKRVGMLSGGEKVRLKFAELVQNDVNFLILDEPTNHLDVRNREILEDALGQFGGTVLFVSHDRYFINKVANKVVELKDGEFRTYLGDYDYYVEHSGEPSSPLVEKGPQGPQKVLKRKK